MLGNSALVARVSLPGHVSGVRTEARVTARRTRSLGLRVWRRLASGSSPARHVRMGRESRMARMRRLSRVSGMRRVSWVSGMRRVSGMAAGMR